MQVNVQYAAQIKTAAKVPGCRVEVPQDTQLLDLVKQLAADGTDELRNLLLDPQVPHPTLLLFVGDELVPAPLSSLARRRNGGHHVTHVRWLRPAEEARYVPPNRSPTKNARSTSGKSGFAIL